LRKKKKTPLVGARGKEKEKKKKKKKYPPQSSSCTLPLREKGKETSVGTCPPYLVPARPPEKKKGGASGLEPAPRRWKKGANSSLLSPEGGGGGGRTLLPHWPSRQRGGKGCSLILGAERGEGRDEGGKAVPSPLRGRRKREKPALSCERGGGKRSKVVKCFCRPEKREGEGERGGVSPSIAERRKRGPPRPPRGMGWTTVLREQRGVGGHSLQFALKHIAEKKKSGPDLSGAP